MSFKKTFVTLLAALVAVGALTACGGQQPASSEADSVPAASGDDKVITIGASPAPHQEILNALAADFEKEGYTLKIQEFTDYVLPNKALNDGEIDANFFQHKPFLDDFNKENKTDLKAVAFVHYEPMAIFPGKTDSLDALKDGDKIAVPNDTSNEARALLLLQENGLIKLKEGSDLNATVRDIEDNPKKLEIVEMEAAQIPRALPDVALAVINGNFAIASDINFDSNLAVEDPNSLAAKAYANIIAVRADDVDSPKTKALVKVLTSDAAKKVITDKYKGTVIPVNNDDVEAYFADKDK